MDRMRDLVRFYDLLDRLEQRLGGPRRLADCNGHQGWPKRGVYFFFELGEARSDSGSGPRVVRVGTHALKDGSGSSLWGRLSQHRGTAQGTGGNHRSSIFRSLIGEALPKKLSLPAVHSWGQKSDLAQAATSLGDPIEALRASEHPLEVAVSKYIGEMPFLWLNVSDPPGPQSQRSTIERGAIALLSNWGKPALDPPSEKWLGSFSKHIRVRGSGLWNNGKRRSVALLPLGRTDVLGRPGFGVFELSLWMTLLTTRRVSSGGSSC
jgi:hypothetical protein